MKPEEEIEYDSGAAGKGGELGQTRATLLKLRMDTRQKNFHILWE